MDSILADFKHPAYLGSGPRNSIWFLSAVPQVAQYLSAVQEHSQLYHQNGEKHIIFLDNLKKTSKSWKPHYQLIKSLIQWNGSVYNAQLLCVMLCRIWQFCIQGWGQWGLSPLLTEENSNYRGNLALHWRLTPPPHNHTLDKILYS